MKNYPVGKELKILHKYLFYLNIFNYPRLRMAIMGLQKMGSGKGLRVREKSVTSPGILNDNLLKLYCFQCF